MLILWALAALALSLILFWQADRTRRSAGMPPGRVIYSDREDWTGAAEVLYDEISGLAGKPDYLVKKGGRMIPVEVKTGRTPTQPYEGHVYQLAAYCFLVERHYGQRPEYGIIQYPQRTYAVDFTAELEEGLLNLLAGMRRDAGRQDIPRSHEDDRRCRGCGYERDCEQSLN